MYTDPAVGESEGMPGRTGNVRTVQSRPAHSVAL